MRDDPAVIDLVARARDGDQHAWDEIVDRYAPLVWFICKRYQLSRANVERRRADRVAPAGREARGSPAAGRPARMAGHHHSA